MTGASKLLLVSAEYLAGIIDGEGTIRINEVRMKAQCRAAVTHLVVFVTNTHLGLLKELEASFGGGISLAGAKIPKSPKWKRCYKLSWNSGKAIQIVATVYPHLIVKRAQAEMAFEFWEQQQGQWHQRLSPDELYVNRQYYLRMRELNQRGPGGNVVQPATTLRVINRA